MSWAHCIRCGKGDDIDVMVHLGDLYKGKHDGDYVCEPCTTDEEYRAMMGEGTLDAE